MWFGGRVKRSKKWLTKPLAENGGSLVFLSSRDCNCKKSNEIKRDKILIYIDVLHSPDVKDIGLPTFSLSYEL
jgi:hypothetical protein